MTVPGINAVRLDGAVHLDGALHSDGPGAWDASARPLLVLGPSLGTAGSVLWEEAARLLAADFDVVAWDLPGHGVSPAASEPFTVAELAQGVLAMVNNLSAPGEPSEPRQTFYAGVSLGGAVGLQLGVDAAEHFAGIAVLCSGAKIGDPAGWRERAQTVRRQGTPVLISGSAQRWFAPGFIERSPVVSGRLLNSLQDADSGSYALCCEALADFDLRPRLMNIKAPVLAVAGEHDVVTPLSFAGEIADGVAAGTAVELPGVAHLAPAEDPAAVAALLRDNFRGNFGGNRDHSSKGAQP